MPQTLELSSTHICLTSLEEIYDFDEKLYLIMNINSKSYKKIPAHFKSVSQKDDLWATWEFW